MALTVTMLAVLVAAAALLIVVQQGVSAWVSGG